ncbi:hypothetical protein [Neobacillus sp. D3-1R]|uniref:hypothetical protein n=1 Tax=Neobacillus sp. D3-1R TaxID=3445778 RepID=UPI003F9FB834
MYSLDFPTILAGPIIRRLAPSEVYIWIALSQRQAINSEIYEITINEDKTHYDLLPTYTMAQEIQLGKQLYVYLIKISPSNRSFPTDTLLGYNLKFSAGNQHLDLSSFDLLHPHQPQSIVYGNLQYPTFHIKKRYDSKVIYGSCRKIHGDGEDTLTLADSLLQKEFNNFAERPDSLFLMGDQIYADDIPDPLIHVLTKLGNQLIGDEYLLNIDKQLDNEPFKMALEQVNGRQFIMEHLCKFTSNTAHNHLIKLGEYAALYLLSWSPDLWELAVENQLFESFEDLLENNGIYFIFSNEDHQSKEYRYERSNLQKRYLEQQEALIPFQHSLYQIRRLLANIPTYMMFDDHDITDDWNLSYDWKNNVYSAPLGRHVVANGLTAYWAFQGWGNQPKNFDLSFLNVVEQYCHSLIAGKMSSQYNQWLDLMWHFNGWQFVTATQSPALFLDIRTHREYELTPQPLKFGKIIKEKPPAPILVSEEGWAAASNLLRESGWRSPQALIIISPTPVYGLGLIESFLHDYVYPLRVLGINIQNAIDYEAWKYNGKGFTEFLLHIAEWNPSECIILSGDVHYASSVRSTVSFPDGRDLQISQFTSSPIKNSSFSGFGGLLLKIAMMFNSFQRKNKDIHRYCDEFFHITRTDTEPEFFVWKDKLRYQPLHSTNLIETKNNLGILTLNGKGVQNKLMIKEEKTSNG